MIDKVLGFQPAVRRKKTQNASQSSSKKGSGISADSSSNKGAVKKLYKDEPTGAENSSDSNPASRQGFSKAKTKVTSGRAVKNTESQQEAPSPLVKNLKMARVPLTVQDMKNSGRFNMRQSAKFMTGGQKKTEQGLVPYKIQLIAFIVISVFLIIFAMTPSRKAPRRRS